MRTLQVMLLAIFLAGINVGHQERPSPQKKTYHAEYIDLNKNGRMDVYENPKADIDRRIDDADDTGRKNLPDSDVIRFFSSSER